MDSLQGSGPTWKETQQVTVTTEASVWPCEWRRLRSQHLAAKGGGGEGQVPVRKRTAQTALSQAFHCGK